jgi:hypothetical protein
VHTDDLGHEARGRGLPPRQLCEGIASKVNPIERFVPVRLASTDQQQATEIELRWCQQLDGRLSLTLEIGRLSGSEERPAGPGIEIARSRCERQVLCG